MARLAFAWRMLRARFAPTRQVCPYCGSRYHELLSRKWLLIQARHCVYCGLIFRYPTDDPQQARRFYEQEYAEPTIVDLPDRAALDQMKESKFHGSIFDKAARLRVVAGLVPAGSRLLDFGSSWGYGVAQFCWAGFDAVGFEPGAGRAAYGRDHLAVAIETDWQALVQRSACGFDLICADHALEHLDRPRAYLDDWARLLRPSGKVLIFVPNGGGASARRLGVRWGPFIGESHTAAYTAAWFRNNLPNHGLRVHFTGSAADHAEHSPDGDELVCVAGKVSAANGMAL
jgi:SAM-dependent methyltransferase